MQRKEPVAQRPLFAEWPAWQQLPEEARHQAEHLLDNMCLEIVQRNNNQEQYDEQPRDKSSTS